MKQTEVTFDLNKGIVEITVPYEKMEMVGEKSCMRALVPFEKLRQFMETWRELNDAD